MNTVTKLKTAGFTLLEVIITLVVAAIVAVMVVTTLGTSMTKSSEPLFRMQKTFALQKVMENFLTAYFEDFEYYHMLPELKTAIETSTPGMDCPQGHVCNSFGNYILVEKDFIKFNTSGNEVTAADTDPDKMLKVTIKNSNNETLTYVFAP
jgi:prepilin-type N-terminal cleavage/methylation domain-containing protein